MSDLNVLEQIKKLVKLQEGDTELYNLKKELDEKPALIQRLEQDFEKKRTRLNALESDFKAVQVERGGLEGDLAQKEAEIAKNEAQLSQIKTNKEYTAKIGEIEGIKADKSLIEEKILQTYDRADEVKAVMEQERVLVEQEEQTYQAQRQEIESQIKDLEGRIEAFHAKRAALLDGIDKVLLERYEKLLFNRGGMAVVPVVDSSCGGCYMHLPPQKINEVCMKKEIITCEMCARILYIEDDVNSEAS